MITILHKGKMSRLVLRSLLLSILGSEKPPATTTTTKKPKTISGSQEQAKVFQHLD